MLSRLIKKKQRKTEKPSIKKKKPGNFVIILFNYLKKKTFKTVCDCIICAFGLLKRSPTVQLMGIPV